MDSDHSSISYNQNNYYRFLKMQQSNMRHYCNPSLFGHLKKKKKEDYSNYSDANITVTAVLLSSVVAALSCCVGLSPPLCLWYFASFLFLVGIPHCNISSVLASTHAQDMYLRKLSSCQHIASMVTTAALRKTKVMFREQPS